MPTTILDGEAYPEALQRRYAEEAKVEERMTTKLEQAARQALGALVRAEAMYGQPNADIQTALREALAEQAEQEPVAWGVRSTDDFLIFQNESQAHHYATEWEFEVTPLYTALVRTVDLTDDEIDAIEIITDRQFARAVIAAYKEKNK